MKQRIILAIATLMAFSIIFTSCKKKEDGSGGFQPNLFSVSDDMTFGQQVRDEIEANPDEYPILKENEYQEAYTHIRRIRDSILNTGLVAYDDLFEYEVYIIENDSVLNAFCTPGGYMYAYTGLIKYLDNEAQFAGVMGHEMAHAAMRHSTDQLTAAYGVSMLWSVLLGNDPNQLALIAADLAAGLATLAYSRNHEYESDEYSVKYLSASSYDGRGVAGFFEKLDGAGQPPEFMSTHPHPENRVEKITEHWVTEGSIEGEWYEDSYQQFKNSLP